MNGQNASSGDSQGKRVSPASRANFLRRPWPKRIAFSIVWILFLFGSSVEQLFQARFSPPWTSYIRILIDKRNILYLAVVAVIAVSRFRPGTAVVQALVLLLFVPFAVTYL